MALENSKKMVKNYVKCERTIASIHIDRIICLSLLIVLSVVNLTWGGIVQIFDLIA